MGTASPRGTENVAEVRQGQARRLRVACRLLTLLEWIGQGAEVETHWLPSAGDLAHALEYVDHSLTPGAWYVALLRADVEARGPGGRDDRSGHKPRRLPRHATDAAPGSAEKQRVLRLRWRHGEQLHHPA